MNIYHALGLVGVLIKEVKASKIHENEIGELRSYMSNFGVNSFELGELTTTFNRFLSIAERDVSLFDAEEMKVNESINELLVNFKEDILAGSDVNLKEMSMAICMAGNKGGEFIHADGPAGLIDLAAFCVGKYSADNNMDILEEQSNEDVYSSFAIIERIIGVLTCLDMYLTARYGQLNGVPEFSTADHSYIETAKEENWEVTGMECASTDDCGCGCVPERNLEEGLRRLQGIEDFLAGVESDDRHYFEGTAAANGIKLEMYSGQEGPVFDAIKKLASEAWKAVSQSWESVKDWFTGEKDEETNKAVVATSDDNKKAIQSIADKAAEINDKAAAGIKALATKVDPSGAMASIVAKLKTPSTAPGVIDGLLGLLNKQTGPGSDLADEKKKAETALADLKKASTGIQGDDSNKEAAAATREDTGIKIKAAKAAVAEAKKKVKDHNRITAGIRKAISGITPHIFVSEPSGAEANAQAEKGGKK